MDHAGRRRGPQPFQRFEPAKREAVRPSGRAADLGVREGEAPAAEVEPGEVARDGGGRSPEDVGRRGRPREELEDDEAAGVGQEERRRVLRQLLPGREPLVVGIEELCEPRAQESRPARFTISRAPSSRSGAEKETSSRSKPVSRSVAGTARPSAKSRVPEARAQRSSIAVRAFRTARAKASVRRASRPKWKVPVRVARTTSRSPRRTGRRRRIRAGAGTGPSRRGRPSRASARRGGGRRSRARAPGRRRRIARALRAREREGRERGPRHGLRRAPSRTSRAGGRASRAGAGPRGGGRA